MVKWTIEDNVQSTVVFTGTEIQKTLQLAIYYANLMLDKKGPQVE
jgi:hypothetical protein